MAQTYFKIIGMDQLAKKLADLGPKVYRSTAKDALKEASKLIIAPTKTAIRSMPDRPGWVHTGYLAKSIGNKIAKSKKRKWGMYSVIGSRFGWASVYVGDKFHRNRSLVAQARLENKLKIAKWKIHDPAKIAHIVEFGSVHAPPHPFMRPVWDHQHGACFRVIVNKVKEAIIREAKK